MNSKQVESKIVEIEKTTKELKRLMTDSITEYCKSRNGNIKELSEKIGMNYTQLSQIVNGRSNPSLRRLISVYRSIA